MFKGLEVFLPDILAGQEEVDSFRVHSPDFKGPSRSRTEPTLPKKQKYTKDVDQVKVINWKSPIKEAGEAEMTDLFPKKCLLNKTDKVLSKLSQQLQALNTDDLDNPWKEYGMYASIS